LSIGERESVTGQYWSATREKNMIIFSAALLLTRTCLQQSMQRSGKNASDIDEQSTGLSSAGQTRKFSDFIVECLDRGLEGMKRLM
jgi:hypothetical protein